MIQWFPGHMHKAAQTAKKIMPQVQLLIEVIDARLPFSSQNPMLEGLRGDKPSIKILNKSDLADAERTAEWQAHLESREGIKTLALNLSESGRVGLIRDLARKLVPARDNRSSEIHALICGIPNVGKSTLINRLAGRTIAKAGNEAAVTRQQQKIDLGDGITLIDTPGMLWGNIENENSGYRLALSGAIRDSAFEHVDVAWFAAEYLLADYPEALRQRYGFEQTPGSEQELFDVIGRARGCLRAGGVVDEEKVAKILIQDFRSGELGGITLETPAMQQAELAEVERIRAEKAARKAERKANWKKGRR